MEGGPAPSLAKVPSRPTCSKPPFPHAGAGRAAPRAPAALPRPPAARECRSGPAQPYRPGPAQPYRPGPAQPNRPGPAPRESWRRPNADRPDHNEERDYLRMVQVTVFRQYKNLEARLLLSNDGPVGSAGFPPYTQPQDLAHAFSEFGKVKVDRIVDNMAALVFTSPEDAKAAIRASTTVNIYGEFLNVKAYTKAMEHRQPAGRRNKQKGPVVEAGSIPWCGEFGTQLQALLAAVRLSQPRVQQLAALYRDLELLLQAAWPGCRAVPFGSVTTGLGVRWSDADCFVALPAGADPSGAVPRARRLLQQHPRLFTELVAIPRANTPIVKFFHVPTRTHCDLSFKTPLGAQNSRLVSFLLHADPRLVPLAVALKYWGGVHELTGSGRLTNYALTMLVLFYLQQPPVSALPPVARLQSDPACDVIVDSWNTGFMSDHRRLPPCSDTSSVAELLGGFFEYYARFNFDDLVVCPFLGRPMRKDDFKEPSMLPEEFERYKANVAAGVSLPIRFATSMCVQDPFEQCHNVASPVSTRLAADIRAYFKFAADTYEKEKLCLCRNFLRTILMEKPKLPRGKGSPEYRARLPPAALAGLAAPDWAASVRDILMLIFQTILKLKLDKVIPDTKERDKPNPDSKRVKETYTGSIARAIWKRKQFSKLYSVMGLKLVERETMITEEILKIDKNAISVEFQLVISIGLMPRSVVVVIKPGTREINNFKEFGKFFTSVIHHWFLVLSKPYQNKVKKDREKKNSREAKEEGDKNYDDASDEEPTAEQLNEMLKQGVDEMARSDSDSDISYEDERIDPNTGGAPSDGEHSPGDADKENRSDTSNISIEKECDANKLPDGKSDVNGTQSSDDKPTSTGKNRDATNDVLKSVSDGKTQIDKSHKCEVETTQSGGDDSNALIEIELQ